MSQQENNTSEEVDLGQLFKAIERLFSRFYQFFYSIFEAIFSLLIVSLRDAILSYKPLLFLLVGATASGFVLEKLYTPKHVSSMLVQTFFESKYQFVSSIEYVNALLDNGDYEELSSLLGLPEENLEKINTIEVALKPESENVQLFNYSQFLESIDSLEATKYSFEKYKQNRDLFDGTAYEVTVSATEKDVFEGLAEGLVSSFENDYAKKKIFKRDQSLLVKKTNIESSLRQVKELQAVYLTVLENESKSNNASLNVSDAVQLQKERSQTKEYELFEQEIKLRKELSQLEEMQIEENTPLEIISDFQPVAKIETSILNQYSKLLPLLTLILIAVLYFTRKVITFTLNYKK